MALSRNIRLITPRSQRFLCTSQHGNATPISSPSATNQSSLFTYTSGRWLWNEQAQLAARCRQFDVTALQQAACQAVGGATRCTSLDKIGEGNYNKAYLLVMEHGRAVIAKIPHPNAGPACLTTASEVATLEFVRTVLNVPVPKVLAWSATDQNAVNAEYIIMEDAATGGSRQLHGVWQSLPLRAKCDIIPQIVDIEKKLLSVSFNKMGSLYFSDCGIPGCVSLAAASVDGQELDDAVKSRFAIGPIAQRKFWEAERSNMRSYHGPWDSAVDYLESAVRREIEWIESYADPKAKEIAADNHPWLFAARSTEEHSPKAHITALRKYLAAIRLITPKDPDLVSARLWHPDFHAGNIYVDEKSGKITSIIDWQGAWTGPVFLEANPPPILDYGVDMLMKLPDNFKQLDDTTKDQLRYQVGQSILIHSYETLTAKENPLMYKMMRYPHGQTLKQLEAFASLSWDNCLYPLQECLIRAEREWEHFHCDPPMPCPYHFSPEEVQRHTDEADSFNEHQSFWANLDRDRILTDEGYTINETFSQAVDVLRNLRESGLARLTAAGDRGHIREFERRTRWVLDLEKEQRNESPPSSSSGLVSLSPSR